jgi:uncharacterized protein (TIGR03000 family)
MQKNPFAKKLAFLPLLALLLAIAPAQAQVVSKWGGPVIKFGWTPYDWDETGLGHYYGRPGPYASYCHFPNNLAAQPGGREPPIPTPPDNIEAPSPRVALVIVKLPAEAELWIDGTMTTQSGSYRQFVTPPLPPGQRLGYSLRVHWHIHDAELTRSETVQVEPGKVASVNFLTVDSWTGTRAEMLNMPRKAQ